ncbi:LysM peptidoglycan-binding domain-containing protein [Paenarthrobacter sp. DKR-5]|uniref:lytic transglycosylase domain-containing protein n=1 Tax=Paenarthrobacter sp. DKR-5 TaxID=2835535 RepID=UPI001BDD6D57|nr:lytic transglycosylase domain-containing protein [Paenarthrobacter sp. DKR-5]MBT1002165.1 LysM peptidoglycan-binding domain-containing protein [Paenarthrobacter sp. DKR-5]
MTSLRRSKPAPKPSMSLLAVTSAALPAVIVSSLALAQPAAAAPAPVKKLNGSLPTAVTSAVASTKLAGLIPASEVAAAVPAGLHAAMKTAPATYTVVRGDTISAIAARYGLSTSSVLSLNKLGPMTPIYPGQKIKLHAGAAAAPKAAPAVRRTAGAAAVARYVVKSGDTLSAIAAKHGVGLSTLLSLNGLSMRSVIYPGQSIKLGAAAAAPAVKAAPARAAAPAVRASGSYTIVSGDTLSGIAARHGVSLSSLLSANRLSLTTVIYPGHKLVIPGKATTSAQATSITPLSGKDRVPSTFLNYTYPEAVVAKANANKAALMAAPVPTQAQMRQIVADTARRMGVSPALAQAFALQESGFNQRAVSPANAIGTMQVIPSSGEWASQLVGRHLNLLNPQDNVTAGIAIIRALLDTSSSEKNAIAGYYQGQYSVSKHGMYADTKAYVAAILANKKLFS